MAKAFPITLEEYKEAHEECDEVLSRLFDILNVKEGGSIILRAKEVMEKAESPILMAQPNNF